MNTAFILALDGDRTRQSAMAHHTRGLLVREECLQDIPPPLIMTLNDNSDVFDVLDAMEKKFLEFDQTRQIIIVKNFVIQRHYKERFPPEPRDDILLERLKTIRPPDMTIYLFMDKGETKDSSYPIWYYGRWNVRPYHCPDGFFQFAQYKRNYAELLTKIKAWIKITDEQADREISSNLEYHE